MRYRQNKKPYLFYPEDQYKVYWDLFITMILLISCLITPWRIAFADLKKIDIEEPLHWEIINYLIDGLFAVDIFVIFNSAYHDDDFNIVVDRKLISKQYLHGWLIVDILAIIPFHLFINVESSESNLNNLARIVRLGRMSKLIKMMRLLRILKLVKERSKLLKYLNEILKIGLGFERLVFFIMIFFIMAHLLTCIWVIVAQFMGTITDDNTIDYTGTWIMLSDDIQKLDEWGLYWTSFYFIIATITTVGFGDLRADNYIERSLCIVIMIIGVISFSFATGSLSSIL
jgi:hypothetical protein